VTAEARYVPTDGAKNAVKGREAEIIRGLGINWHPGRTQHILCPYPDHPDKHPSWRLLEDGRVVCTCDGNKTHSIFDAIIRMRGLDFASAKIAAAEILGRTDLIVEPGEGLTLATYAEAKRLPLEFLRELGLHDAKLGQTPVMAIPFRNAEGRPSGTHFRLALGGDKDKRFRWRKGSTMCLYGAHQAVSVLGRGGNSTVSARRAECPITWSPARA